MIRAIIVLVVLVALMVIGSWSPISQAWASRDYIHAILTLVANIAAVLSVFAALYLWLRSHNLKFYLWIQRLRHKYLPSKSVTWDVQARWEGTGDQSILDNFESWLASHYPGKLSVTSRADRLRSYLVDKRFNIETSFEPLSISSEMLYAAVVIRIYALTVNFAEAKDVLDHDIMPLLDKLSSDVRPLSPNEDYKLTMMFTDNINPFFGLYVQGLRPQDILRFQIVLAPQFYNRQVASQATNIVRVSPQELSITAHSPLTLQTMAQDFLSFAPHLAQTVPHT
jgi:hypothetical protein